MPNPVSNSAVQPAMPTTVIISRRLYKNRLRAVTFWENFIRFQIGLMCSNRIRFPARGAFGSISTDGFSVSEDRHADTDASIVQQADAKHPNNCVKPDLNDFGLMGVHYSEFDKELCRGCKKCAIELNCPMGAASVVDGKMTVNPEICNHCGRCVGKCYFHAVKPGTKAFRIFIGGRWGKKTRHGSMLPGVYTEEEALDMIEKTMLLFREKGQPKERLAALLDRVGEETFFDELLHGDVLARKEEILKDGN